MNILLKYLTQLSIGFLTPLSLFSNNPVIDKINTNIPIPDIKSIEQTDNNINLTWNVHVPESSIFLNETFENYDIDLAKGIKTGVSWYGNGSELDTFGNPRHIDDIVRTSLTVKSGDGIDGSKGIAITKTLPQNGWLYEYQPYKPSPNGGASISGFYINEWKQLKTDRPAIIKLKGKGEGEISLAVRSGWSGNSYPEKTLTWAEDLSADEFLKRLINNTPIKINNPLNYPRENFHLTTAPDYNNSYNFFLSTGDIEILNNEWVFYPKEWYGAWVDSVKPGQVVTPSDKRALESISKGKSLYELHSSSDSTGGVGKISSDDWTDYSYNIHIPGDTEILNTGSYFRFTNYYSSATKLYIDNIQLAYAPISNLYRNGRKIMSDFTVEFNDTTATDITAPDSPKIKARYVNDNIELSWNNTEDNGTPYIYEVSITDENGSESGKSKPKNVSVTSGLKEYEIFINDKLVKTTNDTTFTLQSKNIASTNNIKVVSVDKSNNKSSGTILNIPKLTAKANPKENMIRLDWTGIKDNTYKVFQKKENTNEFQSISTSDLSDFKQIQVLNIYPDKQVSDFKQIKINTWDGESLTLPESASLKQWAEQPTIGYPKGYGMGLIEVTPVSQSTFDSNPTLYLKDSNGEWRYDVVANGFADVNGGLDFSEHSANELRDFINSGRGYLFGHDTINGNAVRNTNNLRDLIKISLPGDIDTPAIPDIKGNVLEIKKTGLLVNYPYSLSGNTLNVPTSHSTTEISLGDVWMKYSSFEGNEISNSLGRGTNNFYLSTWNNVAIIQTGHYIKGAGGVPPIGDTALEATEDEKKILMNTLFYLNQLSAKNFLNDNSGQDVSAPSSIANITHTISNDGSIKFNFNEAADIGTTYSYYVEASSKNGDNVTISNIESTEIKSGVKGFSYITDNIPNTIPNDTIDAQNSSEVTGSFKDNTSDLYLHIKSIDNAGNIGPTTHYKIPITESATIKLDTKINDTLFKHSEPIPLNWSVLGSNNFKALNVKLINVKTKEVYTYNVHPTANTFIVPQIPKGVYNITINAIDFINRPITSNQIQIRVSTFLNKGFVTSKVIETLNPITCLKISLQQSIPKDTLVSTKIYTQNSNGNFDFNNPILIDNSKLDKEIKLPCPTKKLFFEFTLSSTHENSPDIDKISISAR